MTEVPKNVDELTEFAIRHLLAGVGEARSLPYALANRYPDRPALEMVLCMSIAAESIEASLASVIDRTIAQEAWKTASLVAVDVHMMQQLALPHATMADLLAYWQKHDGYFLPG